MENNAFFLNKLGYLVDWYSDYLIYGFNELAFTLTCTKQFVPNQ